MKIEISDKAKEKLDELLAQQESKKSLRIYIAAYG